MTTTPFHHSCRCGSEKVVRATVVGRGRPTGDHHRHDHGPASGGGAATTLGPKGYGDLTIGMTVQQAIATGEIALDKPGTEGGPGCTRIRPGGRPDAGGPLGGEHLAGARRGGDLGAGRVRTPEGIGIGSTFEHARAAYPDLTQTVHGHEAAVPGNPAATFTFSFDAGQKLTVLSLEDPQQDCFN